MWQQLPVPILHGAFAYLALVRPLDRQPPRCPASQLWVANISCLTIDGLGFAFAADSWTWGIAGISYGFSYGQPAAAATPRAPATGQLPDAWGKFPALQGLVLANMSGITGSAGLMGKLCLNPASLHDVEHARRDRQAAW